MAARWLRSSHPGRGHHLRRRANQACGKVILLTGPGSPRVGDDPPLGPDIDLDRRYTRLAGGARLTGTIAGLIVKQIRQAARSLPRPDVSGPPRPDLRPLSELCGKLAEDLRELRPRDRLAETLRQLANAIERTKRE